MKNPYDRFLKPTRTNMPMQSQLRIGDQELMGSLSESEGEKKKVWHVYSSLLGGYLSMDHHSKEDAEKFTNEYHDSQHDPAASRKHEPLSVIKGF